MGAGGLGRSRETDRQIDVTLHENVRTTHKKGRVQNIVECDPDFGRVQL